MTHDSNFHLPQRKNIRLKGYDYSKKGLYFITICVQNRECLFGCIENNQMVLNDAGRMVEKWVWELENKYPDKTIHETVVMPNHFHGIIENAPSNSISPNDISIGNVEMDDNFIGNGAPDDIFNDNVVPDAHVGAPLRGRPENDDASNNHQKYGPNNRVFGATIGHTMDWFKTMTTNEYIRGVKNNGWQRFDGKLWQRNYHEHIIRNEQEYEHISEYIRNNPARWEEDRFR
jgi:putative transposase